MTDSDVAPENLLNIINYKCKLESKNVCGSNLCYFKKSGINCVAACKGCIGENALMLKIQIFRKMKTFTKIFLIHFATELNPFI